VARKIVALITASEPNYDLYAAKYFLLYLNKIQNYYEFTFPEMRNYYYDLEYYKADDLFNSFKNDISSKIEIGYEPDYIINIITARFGANLFFECRQNVAFITTYAWDKYFSPPSLFEYMLHCVVASLLFMHEGLNLSSHHDTRGCYLDYTYYKSDDKVDITLGYLCDKCKSKIISEISEDYYKEINKMINREWIGDVACYGTVAYNLKKFFKVDLDRDSGFNKTFWEKAKEHFEEIPKEVIVGLISAFIGAMITLFFTQFGK
jgi:hypothetical protein